MTVYILVPCYNEESNLGQLVAEISQVCRYIHYKRARSANVKEIVETYGPKRLLETKGFEVQLQLLFKLFTSGAKITEIPFILGYSKERGKNKLRTCRTILGYFKTVLKLKRLQRTFACTRKEQMPWLT